MIHAAIIPHGPETHQPMTNEAVVMNLLLHLDLPKPKLKRHVLKLQGKANKATGRGLLTRVLKASDPKAEILKQIAKVDEFQADLIKAMETGHHGVVVLTKDHYPMRLIFEEDEDLAWAKENEDLIRIRFAHAVMNALNLKELSCNVILFSEHGFSGEYTPVAVAHQSSRHQGVLLTPDNEIDEH